MVMHKASYKVHLSGLCPEDKQLLLSTLDIYRECVQYLISVVDAEWDMLGGEDGHDCQGAVEDLVHATKSVTPKYDDFDALFHKMPCYLRRAAISDAIGAVSSQRSNLANWEKSGKRGRKPRLSDSYHSFPAFYNSNMFKWDGESLTAEVKLYRPPRKAGRNGEWVWREVRFKTSDVGYILRTQGSAEMSSPTLSRHGKRWALTFLFKRAVGLSSTDIFDQRICAVDLGINNAATCSAMESDGTVIARKFVKLAIEEDRLNTLMGRIKKAQRKGAKSPKALWSMLKSLNDDMANKTAHEIVAFANEYSCDVIVLEHLDMQGKVSGTKKQRLSLWNKRRVFAVVMSQAHVRGMRVATVNPWNTSRLAFDGSGRVKRGLEMVKDPKLRKQLDEKSVPKKAYDKLKRENPYSICEFPTGKKYNIDLNASYNVGARYFIRKILREMPETARLAAETEVPALAKRTTCTLSSLVALREFLARDRGTSSLVLAA